MSAEIFSSKNHPLCNSLLRPLQAENALVLAKAMGNMQPWLTIGWTAEHLETSLSAPAQPGVRRFELRLADHLAGLVCVQDPWLHGPYLQTLMILPAFQGQGLGGQVLAWMEAEARAAHKRQLWLCVSAFNGKARAFYQRFGFVEVAVLDQLLCETSDEVLMRKRIL